MDSVAGWFFKELEFSRLYELDELVTDTMMTRGQLVTYSNRYFFMGVPTNGGIYIFYDEDKTPIYVGKARNLRQRYSNHMGGGRNGQGSPSNETSVSSNQSMVKYYSYAIVEDLLERNVYEMLYIGKYRPILNDKNDTGKR